MLQRMEAQDEEFGSRLRALERLSGGEGRRREEDLHDQRRGRRGRRWGGGGDSAGAGRGVKVYGRCPRRPVSNPESRFDSESPKPPLNVNSSCAPSPPAGPAWLKPCRHFSTAPRRRHHRQPRDRPAGEHRAPPRPPPGDVHRREHHRPRPPDGDLPGRGRHSSAAIPSRPGQ